MAERRSSLRSTYSQCLGEVVFHGREEFEGGMLPTEMEVIEMMVWVIARRMNSMQVSMSIAARMVAEVLLEHWVWSNVYPKKLENIQKQVETLYMEFKKLKSVGSVKQTDSWRKDKLLPFLERIKKGFNISTYDGKFLAKQEEKYGVKMEQEDYQYRDDQVIIILILIVTLVMRQTFFTFR